MIMKTVIVNTFLKIIANNLNCLLFYFFRFIAVMHADQDGVVPGNALVVDPKKQFRPLSKFGNAFLNRFQCSSTASEVSFVTFPSNPRFF